MPAPSLRCPYCHDSCDDEALELVECVGCAATHHLDCFVECSGCAVFACRQTSASHGGEVLGLEALDHQVLSTEAGPATAPLRDLIIVSFTLAALIAGVWVGAVVYGVWGALAGGLLGAIFSWILSQALPAHERRLTEVEQLEMEMHARSLGIQTEAGVFIPSADLLRMIHTRLLHGGPRRAARARPDGPPPEHCPHCQESLVPDDPAAAGGLWFCYHCGADLVDSNTHWLRLKE